MQAEGHGPALHVSDLRRGSLLAQEAERSNLVAAVGAGMELCLRLQSLDPKVI